MEGQMQTAFYRRGLSIRGCWYLKKVLEFQSLSDSNTWLCNMVSAKLQQNPQNWLASIITARTILEDGKAGRVAMQTGGFHGWGRCGVKKRQMYLLFTGRSYQLRHKRKLQKQQPMYAAYWHEFYLERDSSKELKTQDPRRETHVEVERDLFFLLANSIESSNC